MPRPYRPTEEFSLSPQATARLIGAAIILFVLVVAGSQATYVVNPGFRGVRVTLGAVSPEFEPEGLRFKPPFISRIVPVMIRQQTWEMKAECYSSDLQQVDALLNVLYRIPEGSVVKMFQEYAGDPFDSLIAPRVQEALKEVTALYSAERIVQNREEIKSKTLTAARAKINREFPGFLEVVDLVLKDIMLSAELERTIEQKMVQEQEAARAKFVQQQSEVEAQTAIIRAKGEAESIDIRGEALTANPAFIQLQVVEKWNGKTPLVVGGGQEGGANILVPLDDLQRRTTR